MSEQTDLSRVTNDSLGQKLTRQVDLWENLPQRALHEASELLRNSPETVVYSIGTGAAIGFTIASASRNPGALGKTAAPYVQEALRLAPQVMAFAGAIDINQRIALPMYTSFYLPLQHHEAKQRLAHNVGSGVLEYGGGAIGGLGGAAAGWHATKPWMNEAPAFEAKPSLRLGETPREVENPVAYSSRREPDVADDVVKLYEKSFPKTEQQPIGEVKDLVASERILVHTTRDESGQLHSFSFTSLHDETPFKFANLDFIATETGAQSRGLGSLHALRLNQMVSSQRPDLLALTLEMEHPLEAGLAADQAAIRVRRARYYDRLDAPDTNVKYNIIDFEDPAYRGPAQWRAWVYDPGKFNAVKAARLMMIDEGGYGLPSRGLAVRQYDRANSFWEPYYGAVGSGAVAAPIGAIASDLHLRFAPKQN